MEGTVVFLIDVQFSVCSYASVINSQLVQTDLKKKDRVHQDTAPGPSHTVAPAPEQPGTKDTPQQSAANSAEDTVDVPVVDGGAAAPSGAGIQHTTEAPQAKTEFRVVQASHDQPVAASAADTAHN